MAEMITVERKRLERHLQNLEDADVYNNMSYIITAQETIREILDPTPTMTTEDWQRVIDEKFLVHASRGMFYIPVNEPATHLESAQKKVVREKGLRQPHFKGHPHPEGKALVEVYYDCDNTPYRMCADAVFWTSVTEYICL